VQGWAQAGKISLELRAFDAEDLDGTFLIVVATASRVLNESIYREAQRRAVLCNVVDDPEYCDFYYPAVVRRGDLQIAISTNGQSPSLAQKLRQQLERQFGPGYARWVAELGETRKLVLASDLDLERKSELLHSLASREAVKAALAESGKDELAKHDLARNERRVTA
jgi:precorrin-2 dehydrogenase/sirohydrochlorin ferrochelatase